MIMMRAKKTVFLLATVSSAFGCSQAGEEEPVTELRSPLARLEADATDEQVQTLTTNNAAFALDLLAEAPEGNVFFSPHSISSALAMTYAGARGETAAEMKAALRFGQPDEDLHGAFNTLAQSLHERATSSASSDGQSFRLNIANALWAQRGAQPLDSYLDTLALYYGAGVNVLDFAAMPEAARMAINAWVAAQTEDKIEELLQQGSVDSDTRYVLTNAIYFNASWEVPFESEFTADELFTLADSSTVTAAFMHHRELREYYAEGAGWKAGQVSYQGGDVSMLVVVPDDGNVDALALFLSQDGFDSIVSSLSYSVLDIKMPKFETCSQFLLKPALMNLGMQQAFELGADFSGIDGTNNLLIKDVIHEAFVKVDEEGTEAAASTVVLPIPTSAPPPMRTLVVDRPFLFFIRDQRTGAVLFLGRIVDPTS